MYCKNCGSQIDEKENVCPNCGAATKEVKSTEKKEKKPITKKWWFWVIVVLLALPLIGGNSEEDDVNNDNNSATIGNQTKPAETKPKEDVIEISAVDLFADYEENEVAADQKYKGKKLKITGVINDIGTDILDDAYITLDTGEGFYSIQCYFAKSELDKIAELSKGETVTLIGVCDGKSLNVRVERCEIQ